MLFDPTNEIIRLCAKGMELEGMGRPDEALELFTTAWRTASNDFEKFTAAHYVARHQGSVNEKLLWDEKALTHALKTDSPAVKVALPSLYLNLAKDHEDLADFKRAMEYYALAHTCAQHLPHDGYGHWIRQGIMNGMKRVSGPPSCDAV